MRSGEGEAAPWRVGARLGDLTIVRKLGQGGMGATFLLEDSATGERSALMLDATDPQAVARFVREGQAQAAAAGHENVLRVRSAGVHAGSPYLVLDFMGGGSLAERLRAGPLPVAEAVRVVLALARGLAHVHARGVLHRDLKPDNVMFDEAGTPKLVDFGLSRVAGAATLTRSGDMIGTPAYMAPEQTETSKATVDVRADVYGLGAVLYAALTGRAPFVGASSMNIVVQVLRTVPEPPSRHREEVTPALDAVCMKALAKRPEERPPSAEAFAVELEGALGGAARRRGSRAVAGVVAAVLLVLGVGGVLVARSPAERASQPPSPNAPASPVGPVAITLGAPETTHGETVRLSVTLSGPVAVLDVAGEQHRQEVAGLSSGAVPGGVSIPLRVGRNTIEVAARGQGGAARAVVFRFRVPPGFAAGAAPGEIVCQADPSIVLCYQPPGRSYLGWSDPSPDPVDIRERALAVRTREPDKTAEEAVAATRNERPREEVELERGFFLGKFELTWAQYRRVEPDAQREARWESESPEERRDHETPSEPAGMAGAPPGWVLGNDMPVYNVSYEDAVVYFRARAPLRLPSEVEWTYAARGGDARRLFPWGDEPPTGSARLANLEGAEDGHEWLAPVGSFPRGASRWGCLDLAGNVFEWTGDHKYDLSGATRRDPRPNTSRVLSGEATGFTHVAGDPSDRYQQCGGSFDRSPWRARNAFRTTDKRREVRTGFRAALDALE